jgi:uncharacterized cysteine cluster protein YcgN (CxxCxxCC family)
MVKLEDEDTGELHYTNVACQYLDIETCRCTDYANRNSINPDCAILSPDNLSILDIMPSTCAYRLFHEGCTVDLTFDELRVSNRVVSQRYIHDEQLPDNIMEWITSNP